MEEDTEWEFDDTTGKITLLYGQFSNDEKFIVEIKYNVGASTSTVASGIFTETITVDASTYTVDAADKYKRHCLDCSGATQVVTLCPLSSLATGDFFYFEHKREGVQAQSKIVVDGSDRILYNGLNYSTNELEELWLAKGESLYLRKEDTYWEVIFDYAGHRVGERMAATYKDHPNYLPEDGRLCDGDEYPALWWWINNVLPSTHVITDDTVVTGGYAHPAAKVGLFVKHSSLKKFRLPNTQNVGERGLLDFDSYGADTNRSYDYPGGYQGDVVGPFTMTATVPKGYSYTGSPNNDRFGNGSSTPQNVAISGISVTTGNSETRVKNIGVIYLRRI